MPNEEWLRLVIASVVSLISGGACGAFINEYFRKRRSWTQEIPLIERVNRVPLSGKLKGIGLYRQSDGQLVEVWDVREFQMTLRNTCESDLRNSEIHFEFLGAGLDAWCSRTKTGSIELVKVPMPIPATGMPSRTGDALCARWKFIMDPENWTGQ